MPEFLNFAADRLRQELAHATQHGGGGFGRSHLFGFVRVSELMDKVKDAIVGRLLVFFPGEYDANNYVCWMPETAGTTWRCPLPQAKGLKTMKNREVFVKDPGTLRLLNNGVAEVAEIDSDALLQTLRFELETFVCEGEYEKGLVKILETFLLNLGLPEQPGIWVSGFYGSGKSHLVKMLRYLWWTSSSRQGHGPWRCPPAAGSPRPAKGDLYPG